MGRKDERCNRNERAVLLLIIGGVMYQHSLRGFPPEGTIPQGPRQWNHITALLRASAGFLWLEIIKEERESRAEHLKKKPHKQHLSALFCSFSARHERLLCPVQKVGFLAKECSVWEHVCVVDAGLHLINGQFYNGVYLPWSIHLNFWSIFSPRCSKWLRVFVLLKYRWLVYFQAINSVDLLCRQITFT